ncbi:helix-turn-helix domain-containing protein [Isoptericola cucumis]|uniref:helix-turn-helix domain-containing protein n=1 Tax=Isoptericola cucumis TaxID=1776856 RepID=UPI00320A24E8
MSQADASAGDSTRRARYRGRHLPMVAVVVAATIATALAYSGMVLFGLEVAHMSPAEAYALAGFLEVSLVAVALMARNAALEGRPYGVLLTLTWVLSGTSGVFAALHEIAVPDESTPYMVAFRFVPPLVAALMWHLALVGERHMVTGHTLDERRRERRVHQYVVALEQWRDARLDNTGSRHGMRKVRTAHRRQRGARDGALKLLTVEDFERRMQVWVERLEAAERHGNRLDSIGASSVKRGTSRGVADSAELATLVAAGALPAAEHLRLDRPAQDVPRVEDGSTPVHGSAPAAGDEPRPDVESHDVESHEAEPFAEALHDALTSDPPADHPAVEAEHAVEAGPAEHADAGPDEAEHLPAEAEAEAEAADAGPGDEHEAGQPLAERPGEPAWALEPLPETGHTRRVEVFDLLAPKDPALSATAQRSAFLTAHGGAAEQAAPSDDEQYASERDRLIVELAAQGLTQREIADRVSASRTTVSRVVRRYGTASDGGRELAPA